MIFVSIVGTQIMAVLNPLMASKARYSDVNEVCLLATAKTVSTANRIKTYLVHSGMFPDGSVTVQTVANGMITDRNGNQPPHEVVQAMSSHNQILFNLAGGMNFHVAACIAALDMDEIVFVYPENNEINLFSIRDGKFSSYPCPIPTLDVDVLSLQGVIYNQVADQKRSLAFDRFLNSRRVTLPVGTLRNVWIGGVLFDAVCNSNNVMQFLIFQTPVGSGKDEARQIIGTAEDRKCWGELYTRTITVVSSNPSFVRRLKSEGRGKVVAMRPQMFKGVLDGQIPVSLPASSDFVIAPDHMTGEPPVLVTAIGRDVLPTLIAIWSHQPKTVYLVYTPDSGDVVAIQQAILKYISLLPPRTVKFVPVTLLAKELLHFEPEEKNVRIEVNITPGTKSQCAMLAAWAENHGAVIYSIDNPFGVCRPLKSSDEKLYKVQSPNPADVIKLSGHELKSEDIRDWSKEKNREMERRRFEFLKACTDSRVSIKALFNGTEKASFDYKYKITDNEFDVTFHGKQVSFDKKNGFWFESLVGYILGECDADDVHLNVATKWDAATAEYLFTRRGERPKFKSEADVVARFGTTYYAVSAKAGKNVSTFSAIAEIKAVATLFGRFSIPVLAKLYHAGDPLEQNGVWVIGPATLFDQAKMGIFLSEVKRSRRTTEE